MIKQSKYFDMKTTGSVHTLTIAEAFPEDEGEYMVTAKNSAGEVSCTATLNVRIVFTHNNYYKCDCRMLTQAMISGLLSVYIIIIKFTVVLQCCIYNPYGFCLVQINHINLENCRQFKLNS